MFAKDNVFHVVRHTRDELLSSDAPYHRTWPSLLVYYLRKYPFAGEGHAEHHIRRRSRPVLHDDGDDDDDDGDDGGRLALGLEEQH